MSVPLPLADAVLLLVALLELSDDEVVDPDSAVQVLEAATYDVLRLSAAERQALADRAAGLAATREDPAMAEFPTTFAEAGGLLDDR